MIRILAGTALITIPLGLDLYLPVPEDNPLTPASVALGRKLFNDPILSRDGTVSCATCHDPRRAFSDGRRITVGVGGQEGTRNAPSLINRAYGKSHFWDGRATTLEQQALEPIRNPRELGFTVDEAVDRLTRSGDYARSFQDVFGRSPDALDLARSLASYVRTILAGNSPYDRYLNGDRRALSSEAQRGLEVFRGRGGCAQCHAGPLLSDEEFHNTGIAWKDGAWADTGRAAVTGYEKDRGAFKTPTLREVARTAPFMHDGTLSTLAAVIDYYDRGGNHAPNLAREIKPLRLTNDEKQALVAFLLSLSGEIREGWR